MNIYLASTGSSQCICASIKAKSIFNLISFFYKKRFIPYLDDLIKCSKSIMVDSGAFSFLACKNDSRKNRFINEIDKFCYSYIDFINEYKFNLFIELDLYSIIGVKKTEELRDKIEQKTQKQVIPVFHRLLGVDYFYKLVDRYKYIAIGGIVLDMNKSSDILSVYKLVKYANDRNVKVHGLGMSNIKFLLGFKPEENFYSIDSASCFLPKKFGEILHLKDVKDSIFSTVKEKRGDNFILKKGMDDKIFFLGAYTFVKLQKQLYSGD